VTLSRAIGRVETTILSLSARHHTRAAVTRGRALRPAAGRPFRCLGMEKRVSFLLSPASGELTGALVRLAPASVRVADASVRVDRASARASRASARRVGASVHASRASVRVDHASVRTSRASVRRVGPSVRVAGASEPVAGASISDWKEVGNLNEGSTLKVGAPDRTRTCSLRLRRPSLYPIELRARRGRVSDCPPSRGLR
jgi:hypothetical protein